MTITSGFIRERQIVMVGALLHDLMYHGGFNSSYFCGTSIDDMFSNVSGDPRGCERIDHMVYDWIGCDFSQRLSK